MSEENGVLVPIKIEETSEAQKYLMLLLNEQVFELFRQDDVLLRPSAEMNRHDLWENLKIVRTNPTAHVGYWLGASVKAQASNTGHFWLNVHMTVWPSDGNKMVFLTPNQTHWICDRLKTNPLLKEILTTYVSSVVVSLRNGLDRLQKDIDDGNFWEDRSKHNGVFDVASRENPYRGWYTSWDAFLENVCPPPPWLTPGPNLQYQWDRIKMIGGKRLDEKFRKQWVWRKLRPTFITVQHTTNFLHGENQKVVASRSLIVRQHLAAHARAPQRRRIEACHMGKILQPTSCHTDYACRSARCPFSPRQKHMAN